MQIQRRRKTQLAHTLNGSANGFYRELWLLFKETIIEGGIKLPKKNTEYFKI